MKKIVFGLIIFLTFINVYALDINSKNAVLYNLNDDNVIYEKSKDEKIQIASLTKIMTSIVAIENIDNINDYVTLKQSDFKGLEGYAKAGFNVGDKVTYEDLLYGIILPSGADAVQAIANNVSGSIDDFVELMNKKAVELNLKNTHFDNPIGMDSVENYSSVDDVAKTLKYALKNKDFKKIFTTKKYTTTNGLVLSSTISAKAKVLNKDASYILGSKTGTTNKAGLCLASIASLSNIDYLLVTCGAKNGSYPYNLEDALDTYNYYDENYEYKTLISKNQLLKTLKVKKSTIKKLDIYSNKNIKVYAKKNIDLNNLEYKYDGLDVIDYKLKVGDKLGVITVMYEGEELYTYDVVLNTEIKKFPYYLIYISIFVFLMLIIYIKNKKKKRRIKRRKR